MRARPTTPFSRWSRVRLVGILLAVVVTCTSVAAPAVVDHPGPSGGLETVRPGSVSSVATATPRGLEPVAARPAPEGTTTPTSPAGVVVRTVFPGYNATLPGAFLSTVADWQFGTPTYVPADDSVWFPQTVVPEHGAPVPGFAPTAVFNLLTGRFAGFETALSNLSALAYDPQNGLVYGTNTSGDSVVAFNVTTGTLVGSPIPVGASPRAIVYDAPSHNLFVANSGSANLTVIDALDDEVAVANVPVGTDPVALADASEDGTIFVANAGSPFLSGVTATDPAAPDTQIPLYDGPADGVAYSPADDRLLAVSAQSDYATLIRASTDSVLYALIQVGTGFGAVVSSYSGTEFVAGNATGENVAVVNSSLGTVVDSSVVVGANVSRLITSPINGTVLCWTTMQHALVGLNLTSQLAYRFAGTTLPQLSSTSSDLAMSQVLLGVYNQSGLLAATERLSNGVLEQLETAYPVNSVAVDSADLRAYVGTSNDLEVLNASTGQEIVAATGVSGQSRELVVDVADDLLWFMNSISGVSALNLSTDTLAFSTGLLTPGDSTSGIALDSANDELFVLVTSSAVAVVNARTGHTIDTSISVGSNVTSLAYDPADNEVYAAGDSLTLLNATTLDIDASSISLGPTHRVSAEIYDPTRQDVYISTVEPAPLEQGTLLAIDGRSVVASEGSAVQIPVGEDPSAITVVPGGNESASGSGIVWVTNELSGTASVIASPPSILSFAAYPGTIDLGQSTTFQVQYVGGAGASAVSFVGLPPGHCGPAEVTLNCTPSETGSFHVIAVVNDSFEFSAEASTSLTVLNAPTVGMTVTPSTLPLVDVGFPVNATATAAFGMPPYTFVWNFGDGTTATGVNVSHQYSEAGSYSLTVVATDSSGASNYSSRPVTVVADPSARVLALTGNRTDVNLPLQFSGSVQGGVGLERQWWLFGDSDSGNGQNVSHAWERAGEFTVRYTYLDLLGETSNATTQVTVSPSLSATFTSADGDNSTSVSPGQPVDLSSTVSGGTAPYAITWAFGDGSFASGAGLSHAYAEPGTYAVNVTVTDAVGEVVKGNLTISVTTAPASGGGIASLGGGFASGLFLGILLGGVAAAVVLATLGSRRSGKRGPRPVSPYVPP